MSFPAQRGAATTTAVLTEFPLLRKVGENDNETRKVFPVCPPISTF
jgi:hypothetical protein